jgi:hypothetical protein
VARKHTEIKTGCMAKAFDNEPTFVLLARDIVAPEVIREWCRIRCLYGKNKAQDEQIQEALGIADLMDKERDGWRREIQRLRMAKEGVTEQDISETMPPRHPDFK